MHDSSGETSFRFKETMGGWVATIALPDSPFKERSVEILISTRGGQRPSQRQLELVDQVQKSLPTLVRFIARELEEYYTVKQRGTGAFYDTLCEPAILLSSEDDEQDDAWSFMICCPDTPGDPSVGDGTIYFVKFRGMDVVDVYAAD